VSIELPVGSYVPEFRSHDVTPPILETVLTTSEIGLSYGTEELVHPALPVAVQLRTLPKRSFWNKTSISLIAAFLLAVAVTVTFAIRGARASEADRLWIGAFGGKDVLLCAGPLGAEQLQNRTAQQYSNSGISFTIAKTLSIVGSAIGRTGGSTFLIPMQETKLEDLQRSPAVLLGAYNNEWMMRLQAPLRYQFFSNADGSRAIIDTKILGAKRLMADDQPQRDYGILAHFHSPSTGQSTVIIGGLGTHGTAAVRIFLSSPELLEEFSKLAPHGWEKGNYEIVLSSDSVNKLADSPKVVATSFW
jgi:hypothetical protein